MIVMVNAFRWIIFVIGLAVIIGSIMVTSAGDPIIEIDSPSDGDTVYTNKITVSGGATGREGAIVKSVTVNGIPTGGTTSWHKDISLNPGLNEITVVAKDNMGQSRLKSIKVTYNPPTPTPTYTTNPTTPTPTTTTIPNGGSGPAATPAPTPTPTGSILITTTPDGAEVYLDDSDSSKGITPITLENVTLGHHMVKVIKEGYRSETRKIYLRGGKTEKMLNIELKPITISIIVYSIPSGAKVYLDDVYMNKITPCVLSEVVVGLHTIKLTKSGYDDVIRNVSVSAGRTFQLHENLTESTRYGYIDISSDPPGAKVYLDGNYKGETPTNISTVALGNHTIKLTLSDYFDVIRNVSVSVGETCPLCVNLTGYGSLCISSNPPKAKVYLDNVYKGETALNISKVIEGMHTIKLTKSGYEDVEKMIPVPAGELIEVDETLSIPAWAKLLVEGGAMGVILAIIGILSNYVVIPVISPKLKKKSLFNLDLRYKQCLKDGDIDAEWKKVFEKKEQPLTSEAKVSKIPEQWRIEDGKKQYRVEDSGKQLDIYKKRSK